MSLDNTEIETMKQQLEHEDARTLRKKLNSMKGSKASQQSISSSLLSLIPFFNTFIASASGAGNAITSMIEMEGRVNNVTQTTAHAFQHLKLGTAFIDFFRIPAIYVGAYITQQQVPFTFSRNAQFLYSGALLGLTITALAFPFLAPAIALVGAMTGLGQSVVSLATIYYKRYELQDKLEQTENDILAKKEKIIVLIGELETLENPVNMPTNKALESLTDKIAHKKEEIAEQLIALQTIYDAQEHNKQKLDKLGTTAALYRTVGVGFATIALIGVLMSILVPPAGMAILVATASLALSYFVARVTFPWMKSLGEKIINALAKKSSSKELCDSDALNLKNGLSQNNNSTKVTDIGSMFLREDLIEEGKYLASTTNDPVVTPSNKTLEKRSNQQTAINGLHDVSSPLNPVSKPVEPSMPDGAANLGLS